MGGAIWGDRAYGSDSHLRFSLTSVSSPREPPTEHAGAGARPWGLLADPEIVARGVAQFEGVGDGDILGEALRRLRRAARQAHGQLEYGELVQRAKETLSSYLWHRLRLRPPILPVITAL